MDLFKEAVDALLVDTLGGFQNLEVHTNLGRQMDESLHILWKTKASVTETGFEELAADARIESHGMRHFFDVCTDFFAQIGDYVCITDFQREERIRRVLNELGAIDGGNEEFSLVAWRAGPIMHGEKQTPLVNGTVDFPQLRSGGMDLAAN